MSIPKQYSTPSSEVVTSIVLPTIAFCIVIVIAMLIGIYKCKQWELDKIVEMRRGRRIVQEITERLRQKNFNTIQKARKIRMRKRKHSYIETQQNNGINCEAPPSYSLSFQVNMDTSPPPSYEDAVLNELYNECYSGGSPRSLDIGNLHSI